MQEIKDEDARLDYEFLKVCFTIVTENIVKMYDLEEFRT